MAVLELATQNLVSGTSRLFGALMSSVLLGFGMDLGHRLVFWERPDDWISTASCSPVGVWTRVPLFLATVLCFSILVKAAPAQWLGMLVLSALSFTTINVATQHLDASSSIVLTSFLIGIGGNLYSYATNSPALIPMLIGERSLNCLLACLHRGVGGLVSLDLHENIFLHDTTTATAIFLLVPGGMSVRGVHALVNSDNMDGSGLWGGVLVTAVSISIGLFSSAVLMYKPKCSVTNTVFF